MTYAKPSRRGLQSCTSTQKCGSPGDADWTAALAKQPDEIVPYKILPQVVDSVKQVVAA